MDSFSRACWWWGIKWLIAWLGHDFSSWHFLLTLCRRLTRSYGILILVDCLSVRAVRRQAVQFARPTARTTVFQARGKLGSFFSSRCLFRATSGCTAGGRLRALTNLNKNVPRQGMRRKGMGTMDIDLFIHKHSSRAHLNTPQAPRSYTL